MKVKTGSDGVTIGLTQDEAFILYQMLEALTIEKIKIVFNGFSKDEAADLNEFTAVAASLLKKVLW